MRSSRGVAEVLAKILGIYLLVIAVQDLVTALIWQPAVISEFAGMATYDQSFNAELLKMSQFSSAAVFGAAGLALILNGRRLAASLAPASESTEAPTSALSVGLLLLGLWLALPSVAYLVRFAGELLWYLGEDRQDQLPNWFTAYWPEALQSLVAVAAGGYLVSIGRKGTNDRAAQQSE